MSFALGDIACQPRHMERTMSEQAAPQTQTETISEADVTDSGSQVRTFVVKPDVTRGHEACFWPRRDKSLSVGGWCIVDSNLCAYNFLSYHLSQSGSPTCESRRRDLFGRSRKPLRHIGNQRRGYAFCYVPQLLTC